MKTKFYQDPNDRMVRGVCAGLARGWGVDSFWVRALFGGLLAAGFFTVGISSMLVLIVYAILALLMPTKEEAEDEAQEKEG